ncbi:PhnA domain-containing protein [Neptunomonas japonica]|uniref:Phosphonoacetate hydrolase n=1 Tax=Neptunomonas japonica JAMM 1380 TaxID=1441457 RepID=A0A7R6PSN8_9GAMM|nr:alkylphosphonate utilization protein [Neptunomonas japonica]BBB29675.1 phosphonoacetate hydrolase [Neptunomonas japonica JAMM 1380]
MTIEKELMQRSNSACELCSSTDNLSVFEVSPSNGSAEQAILTCEACNSQINKPDSINVNHWRCLNDSMWSQIPAVQVMAWRQLKQLSSMGEIWAQDLLDMLYLDEETQTWAQASDADDDAYPPAKDSNGATLNAGDNVTLIKDLDVKGAGFTAKRGTAVRGISLTSNPDQIEGRVNGTRIVLLTKFLKKQN